MGKRKKLSNKTRYAINTVLIVAIIAIIGALIKTGTISNYYNTILMLIGINIILTVSLNVATGYLGQLPLGHAGFMAVGGYAAGIFMKSVKGGMIDGVPSLIIGVILGGVVAAIFGLAIGIPALRLKGDYLAIVTLGFGEIIRVVLLNIDTVIGRQFTGGAAGLMGIPKNSSFISIAVFVAITCIMIHMMMKSKHGRAILSIRENEIAAESCGIKTTYYKTLGFVVSAFFAGVAGALYAGYLGILVPKDFGFMKSIEILVMVVLGGMGSMIGSVISASVLTVVPFLLQQISQTVADYRMVIYSILLIVVMIFKPSGLMGTYDFSLGNLLEKFLNKGEKGQTLEEQEVTVDERE